MRLENTGHLASGIQFFYRLYTGFQLGRMMCIIVDQCDILLFQVKVETTFRACERSHAFLYFLGCYTVQPCQGDSGNPVLYIHFHGDTQLDVGDTDIRANEIEPDLTVSDTDILRMEIASLGSRIGI